MFHETNPAKGDTVPLRTAVLCVDCEAVSASRHDQCAVCGGHSLLVLARLLGGPLSAYMADKGKDESVLFNANIAIELRGVKAEEFSAAVAGIAGVIAPALGRDAACFHIDVAPVAELRELEAKAA